MYVALILFFDDLPKENVEDDGADLVFGVVGGDIVDFVSLVPEVLSLYVCRWR